MGATAQSTQPSFEKHRELLEVAAAEAIKGVPARVQVDGVGVVLISELDYRSLTEASGRPGGRSRASFPTPMEQLISAIGTDAALNLVHARGGRRISIPSRVQKGHWLVRTIGREAAGRLCNSFRASETKGTFLVLPVGPTSFYETARTRAAEMTAQGLSISTIALRLGVTMRAVEKWRAKSKADGSRDAGRGRNTPPVFQRNRIEDDV